jgi:hypothetical protein
MDILKIITELRQEQKQIEDVILGLEQVAKARGPRRGRPPAWMSGIAAKRRGRPMGSRNKTSAKPANITAVA